MADASPVKPTLKGRLVALGIGVLVTALAAEGILRVAAPAWREFDNERLMTMAPVPDYGGVRIGRPGFDGYHAQNNGDFRVHIQVNGFGLRNPEPISAADGRVWTMGDSMTFGFGVERGETYAERLRELIGEGVYNVAGPGNDVCGYYAMAKRLPAEIRPRAIILGLFLENDVRPYDCPEAFRQRSLDAARPATPSSGFSLMGAKEFFTENSALYNFVAVNAKRVEFINKALTAVGLLAREHAEKPHPGPEQTPELARRTAFELRRLRDLYPGVPFAVLMIPARLELRDASGYYQGLRKAVAAALRGQGLPVIDPFPELKSAGFRKVHFVHDGHWTARGHAIAAAVASEWLRAALAGSTR